MVVSLVLKFLSVVPHGIANSLEAKSKLRLCCKFPILILIKILEIHQPSFTSLSSHLNVFKKLTNFLLHKVLRFEY